jgi:hypothetical protein
VLSSCTSTRDIIITIAGIIHPKPVTLVREIVRGVPNEYLGFAILRVLGSGRGGGGLRFQTSSRLYPTLNRHR